MKWTDLFIRNLEPKATRYDLREGDGFTVRVSPNGTKTFYFIFTIASHKRRMFLGEYDPKATDPKGKEAEDDPMPYKGLTSLRKARARHTVSLSLVRAGIDPVAKAEAEEADEKARQVAEMALRSEEDSRRAAEDLEPTVSKLVDLYLEKWAKAKKRTWQEDERQLKKDVVPVLGNLKARDVTRGHIRALLDGVVERGAPVAANRLLAVVQRMFAWATDKEIVPASPCLNLKMPSGEVPKDRVLTPAEVRTLWEALDSLPLPFDKKGRPRTERREGDSHAISDAVRRALKLVLVTAQRPGEVAGMTWEEIEDSWWTIPAERAKNGLSHRVHLSGLALEILGPRGTGYVFPSPRKENGPINRSALAHALRDNRDSMGIAEFAPHDLRRTAASLMAGAGVNPFTIERVLNHSLGKIQKIYNRHSYDNEKREALNRWAAHLEGLLEGTGEERVVDIGARRKAT